MTSNLVRGALYVLWPVLVAIFLIGLGAVVVSLGVLAFLLAIPIALILGALLLYARRRGGKDGIVVYRRIYRVPR